MVKRTDLHQKRPASRKETGVALIMTLLVLTLLITLILDFNNAMRVEARAAANFRDDLKAYHLAQAGVTFARAVLEEDAKPGDPSAGGSGGGTPGVQVDALTDAWAQKTPPLPLGDGVVSVEITDEERKLNINQVVCGSPYQSIFGRFLEYSEMKADLACALADWIDNDGNSECTSIGCSGSESDTYRGLEVAYEAKNAPYDSLEELRLTQGMDEESFKKVRDFWTPYGDGKVNLNTAPFDVLVALDDVMKDYAQEIVDCRKDVVFEKLPDVGGCGLAPDTYNKLVSIAKFSSSFFSIVSHAEVNGVQKTIHAVVSRIPKGSDVETKVVHWKVD